MNLLDPILDQPQSIAYEELDNSVTYPLANQDVRFAVDAGTDLLDLQWPWTAEVYARSIRMRISDPRDDKLVPMVTRYYPGYQELILGSEGMIVSKRLVAPFKSAYDRAVIWMLECQVEGDRLLRLEIDIDWGEPLTQRMVDGLLVAQRNPGAARGIYAQSNAERTCVFGNPYGRPDVIDLESGDRAHLVYHVLVNGMVEVPLLLTMSDVGEQVAWSGFLALRDTERAYELTVRAWQALVKTSRLWTPDANFNRTMQAGKLETMQSLQRLRGGTAPMDQRIEHLPALVESLDALDIIESRNLLAHIRRLAEQTNGRLPVLLPMRNKEAPVDPAAGLVQTDGAYLTALHGHIQRHFDLELLQAHYAAVQACTEALIKERRAVQTDGRQLAALGLALRQAQDLAMLHNDGVNAIRWESEACEAERLAKELQAQSESSTIPLTDWLALSTWQTPEHQPWHFADPWRGIALAGQGVWRGGGLSWIRKELWVQPTFPKAWSWWALLDLPLGDTKLSLLWDGATLHSTRPVRSKLPVQVHQRIRAIKADEYEFNLEFELKSEQDGQEERQIFKPKFA
ncbi:MAG: hypothetical protein NT075_06390 [Chloroflexi bacterium]|nr:hypothetical protein [Chloroflexota bacterium]